MDLAAVNIFGLGPQKKLEIPISGTKTGTFCVFYSQNSMALNMDFIAKNTAKCLSQGCKYPINTRIRKAHSNMKGLCAGVECKIFDYLASSCQI